MLSESYTFFSEAFSILQQVSGLFMHLSLSKYFDTKCAHHMNLILGDWSNAQGGCKLLQVIRNSSSC